MAYKKGNMNKDIKLIALDLDGTLLGSDEEIVNKNKEVIKKLHDKGIKIVIATGRPFNGFWWIREELGLEDYEDYSISNTGAFVRRNADAKIIIDNSMDKKDYEKISSLIEDEDIQLGLFTKDVLYNNADEVNEGFKKDQEILRMPRQKFKDFEDIEEKIARVNFMGTEEVLDKFYDKVKEDLEKDYMLIRNETYSLEVHQKSSGKANSLKRLCEYLDIDLDKVIYFGDGSNDKESLELAGFGIAMGNANDESKKAADKETLSNDDGGVGKFLEQFLD
ncbi:Cof-type HAD-IIB family hydrolase [uncultured Anaerococcus sp.]|uniref:Cof-type HAD-IIB family hydrolase n=1 Tax=uncultured Anaerococcus sp. TaxID=293428 RepID=UPI002633B48D|nr:Cof-type HAD-IIB family hydrolase [uncultured Anaerococcus sp.]